MQFFVARQPIFDRQEHVYAYELLFRSGLDNYFQDFDADQASSKVITNTFLGIGIEKLTADKRAFINFTRNLLVKEYATLFPKELLVVEVLEDVEPSAEIVAACRKLKELGYLIALDDFIYAEKFEPLIALADIIKVDFTQTVGAERETLVQQFSSRGIELLAEKVETREEYNQAMDLGYDYFQGYFFSKPEIVSGHDIPTSKLTYFTILREIGCAELDLGRIEALIKQEVSLSYKLLKYINSALFGLRSQVTSIKQALTLLGQNNVRKWIALVALSQMGEDKPLELVVISLTRAKLCESVSDRVGLGDRSQDLFLLGLFSMIDVLMDRSMPDLLADLPIAEDIKAALLGEDNRFRSVFDSVFAYESGTWEEFSAFSTQLQLDEDEIPGLYAESVEWAKQITEIG